MFPILAPAVTPFRAVRDRGPARSGSVAGIGRAIGAAPAGAAMRAIGPSRNVRAPMRVTRTPGLSRRRRDAG
ncbi:hypothetical protein BURK1_02188 [Burkholderiales bacterium]|nr:hypothetical protein BURK1_02188 [Burkholderiales bacterium]